MQTDEITVEFYSEGKLIRVKEKKPIRKSPLYDGDGKIIAYILENKRGKNKCRGIIRKFSKSSRLRLMQKLSMLNMTDKPYFLTLTYPSQWPSPQVAKGHLRAFIKRCCRRFGKGFACLWKLEFQKRGAPHFHLFVWGIMENLTTARAWIADSWADVCDMNDDNHVKAGTSLEKIRKWNGVRYYAAKYLGKRDDTEYEKSIGRVWGVSGKLPYSCVLKINCNQAIKYKLLRYLRKRNRTDSKRMRNFILENPHMWFDRWKDLFDPVPF